MNKMAIKNPRRIAKLLRATAAAWHNAAKRERTFFKGQFSAGICCAMQKQSYLENPGKIELANRAYDDVGRILRIVENRWAESGRCWLLQAGRGFNQRAMMCLFMAEWLETDYTGQE